MASSVSTASLGSSRTRSGRSATATAAPLGAAPVAASVAVPQSTLFDPATRPDSRVMLPMNPATNAVAGAS